MERDSSFKPVDKIVVCPDSFKGSLTSYEAAVAISAGLREAGFDGEIDICPLSDGGEGINDIIATSTGLQEVNISAVDALDRPIGTSYLVDETGNTAFIESATTVGLDLLAPLERNPMETSSRGLGIVISDACRRGCREIYVALGGSAVCDAGMGMLGELGIRFLDASGKSLKGCGKNMTAINSIKIEDEFKSMRGINFHAVSDVTNPLTGKNGAVMVFAPQKGATPGDLSALEQGVVNLADKADAAGFGSEETALAEGAGAAGGIGYALKAFLGADYISGIEFVLDSVGFDERIDDASLIITGEGKVDRQSVMGKVPAGVLKHARAMNIPVVAVGGLVSDRSELEGAGFASLIESADPSLPLEENMRREVAMANISRSVKDYFLANRKRV